MITLIYNKINHSLWLECQQLNKQSRVNPECNDALMLIRPKSKFIASCSVRLLCVYFDEILFEVHFPYFSSFEHLDQGQVWCNFLWWQLSVLIFLSIFFLYKIICMTFLHDICLEECRNLFKVIGGGFQDLFSIFWYVISPISLRSLVLNSYQSSK